MLSELIKLVLILFGTVKVIEELNKKYQTRKLRAENREKNRGQEIEPIAPISKADFKESSNTQQKMFVDGIPGRKIEPINEEPGGYHSYQPGDDGAQYVSVQKGSAVNEDGEVVPTLNGIPVYTDDIDMGFEDEEF